MKLSVKALAIASGLVWGGALLIAGLIHLTHANYASAFLQGMGSIYPGFHAARNLSDVLIGTAYALVDGAIAGFFVGLLYNALAGSRSEHRTS